MKAFSPTPWKRPESIEYSWKANEGGVENEYYIEDTECWSLTYFLSNC